MKRKSKRATTTRPRSSEKPVSVWLQLFKDDEQIALRKYENISLLAARQKAYQACLDGADRALVLRGGCDPDNPHYSDIWEDYTTEEGLKGFVPIPTIKYPLSDAILKT